MSDHLNGSRAVCVLGMHRSGTSMIASLLEPLGVYLGAIEDLRDDAAGDPHGYWEHRPLKAINEQLLARLGADWQQPPLLADGWQDAAAFGDLRHLARRRLAAYMGGHPLWGWKDPRTSLTLPFWQPLLPDTRYVICLRHPVESARSLEARDALPLWHGLRLWLFYTAAALRHTAGRRRLLLFYEDVLADPDRGVDVLARFLDRPLPADAADARRVTTTRRHQQAPPGAEDVCPATVRTLLGALREHVGSRGPASDDAAARLDVIAASALTAQCHEDGLNGRAGWLAPSSSSSSWWLRSAWDCASRPARALARRLR